MYLCCYFSISLYLDWKTLYLENSLYNEMAAIAIIAYLINDVNVIIDLKYVILLKLVMASVGKCHHFVPV